MNSVISQVGIPDLPIEDDDSDRDGLQIGDYALALSTFIEKTNTPMTIGFQGDWGSGKTSLMNLIRNRLNNRYHILWINTWKYAQTESGHDLAIAVFLAIIQGLSKKINTDLKEKRTKIMSGIGKALLDIGGKISENKLGVNLANALKSEDPREIDKVFDRYESLEKLKEELTELVAIITQSNSKHDRIVMFVDDLDRIQPERTVEILEIIKIFLDIPGLVFLLACDYEVILKGLRSKGELAGEEVSGRSFFDKIIQVPFQMPQPTKEKLAKYIGTLLKQIGATKLQGDDIEKLMNALERTTGTNPRTIKRLINIVNLLLIILDNDKHDWDDKIDNKAVIVFILVAIQNALPEVYSFLSRRNVNDTFKPITQEDIEGSTVLKRANTKKMLDIEKLNHILAMLEDLIKGDSKLLSRFISLSDIAAVEESVLKEDSFQPTYYAKKFIEKQSSKLQDIINFLIKGLPAAQVSFHGNRDASLLKIRNIQDDDFRVGIYTLPRKGTVCLSFSIDFGEVIKGLNETFLEKFNKFGITNIKREYNEKIKRDSITCEIDNDSDSRMVQSVQQALQFYLLEAPTYY